MPINKKGAGPKALPPSIIHCLFVIFATVFIAVPLFFIAFAGIIFVVIAG